MPYIYGFILSFIVCVIAHKKGSLTLSGMIASVILGTLLFGFQSETIYMSLVGFFISSSFLSKISKFIGGKESEEIEKRLEKSGKRDYTQVIANGGVVLLGAALFQMTNVALFKLGAVIAIAAANADTWASEIGVLSKDTPLNILSKTPVAKGLSGGVTKLGFMASFAGALFIALIDAFLSIGTVSFLTLMLHFALIAFCGFLGSIIDSILGEVFQAKYQNPQSNELTEKVVELGQMPVKGIKIVTNNVVNFFSGLIAAGLGMLMLSLMRF